MQNQKKLARLAGLAYLIIIVTGLFSELFVREAIFDPTSIEATLTNIKQNEFMFRLGFFSDLIMVIADIAVAILFLYLLKPVSEILSKSAAYFRLVQASVIAANLLNQFMGIILANSISDVNITAELVNVYMQAHNIGYLISNFFFGISCIILSYLFIKAEFMPKLLGYFLIVGGIAYLFTCLANFLFTDLIELSDMVVMVTAIFSELAVCLYLLIKGTKR